MCYPSDACGPLSKKSDHGKCLDRVADLIHVAIDTKDYPFLAYAPELQSVLVQRLALDQLNFETSSELVIVLDVRKVARRTPGLWDDALGRAFDNAEGLAKRRDRNQAS